jgi:hypothetical protein
MRIFLWFLACLVVGCSSSNAPPKNEAHQPPVVAISTATTPELSAVAASLDGLPHGKYAGFTLTTTTTTQMQNKFNIFTKQLELQPTLVIVPSLAPSPVGDLLLDGQGGYELTGIQELGRTGSYRFEAKTDSIEFTSGVMKGNRARINRARNGAPEIVVSFPAGEKDGQAQTLSIFFTNGTPNPDAADRLVERQTNGSTVAQDSKPLVKNGGYIGTLLVSGTGGTNLVELATGKIESPLPGGLSHRHCAAKKDEFTLAYAKSNQIFVRVIGPSGDPLTEPVFSENWSIVLPDTARPALSPDGQKLACYRRVFELFAQPQKNFSGIVVLDRKGNELATFPGMCDAAWTLDGRLVLAGARSLPGGPYLPDAQDGLFLSDVAVKKLTPIPGHFEPPSRPDVSPDGKTVAFLESNAIWSCQLDGTNRTKIATCPSGSRYYSVAWSPDGTAIASLASGSILNEGVYIQKLADKQLTIVRDSAGNPLKPGSRLAWWNPAR